MAPLADLGAWEQVRRILRQSGKRFGAFLAPLTSETHFAGYALRELSADDPLPPLLPEGPLAGLAPERDYPLVQMAEPGTCIFWLDPALFADIPQERLLDYRRGRAVRRLHVGAKACVRYQRPPFSDAAIQLCYSCFGGRTRELSLGGARAGGAGKLLPSRSP